MTTQNQTVRTTRVVREEVDVQVQAPVVVTMAQLGENMEIRDVPATGTRLEDLTCWREGASYVVNGAVATRDTVVYPGATVFVGNKHSNG